MPDGSIKLLLQIDRENPPSTAVSDRIQLTVKATEIVPPGDDPFQSKQSQVGYPFSIETFISINIVDVDDNVPTFYKLTAAGNVDSKVETQAFTVDLSEDASVGSAVQNLNIFVEDLDKDENAHFFLKIDDSNVPFTLSVAEIFESSTVDVRIIGLEDLDYESDKKSYSFKIQAVDSTDSVLSEADITINLLDSNDNSPVFVSSPVVFSVSEDAYIGDIVGVLQAIDSDSGVNGNITYSLNDENEFFQVLSTGEVLVKSELDRETRDLHYLTFTATDGGGKVTSTTGEITVTDINDISPTWIRDSYFLSILDNDDSFELEIKVEDLDSGLNGEVEFSIETSEYSNYFQVVSTQINTALVQPTQAIDLENINGDCTNGGKIISIVIIATDKGIPSKSSNTAVDITIQDLNEFSPVFSTSTPTNASVNEMSLPGTFVAQLQATDNDACSPNNIIDYSIEGENVINFDITNNGTLQVRNEFLNREEKEFYQVDVIASDFGNPRKSTTFSIQVQLLDVNDETPVFDNIPNNCEIVENSAALDDVCQIRAIDSDENSNLMYKITSYSCFDENENIVGGDNCNNWFDIQTITEGPDKVGQIKVANGVVIDRERVELVEITIEVEDLNAIDGADQVITTSLEISIIDEDDNLPTFTTSGSFEASIKEGSAVGSIVQGLDLFVEDLDKDEFSHFFLKLSDDVLPFELSKSEVFRSSFFDIVVKNSEQLDFDSDIKQYDLKIQATDSGDVVLSEFDITIKLLDSNDNSPVFVASPVVFIVPEDANIGDVVGVLDATDADSGTNKNIIYGLNADNEFFEVSPTGEVFVKSELDTKECDLDYLTFTATA